MAANKKSLSGSDGIESHSKNKPRKPRRGQGR